MKEKIGAVDYFLLLNRCLQLTSITLDFPLFTLTPLLCHSFLTSFGGSSSLPWPVIPKCSKEQSANLFHFYLLILLAILPRLKVLTTLHILTVPKFILIAQSSSSYSTHMPHCLLSISTLIHNQQVWLTFSQLLLFSQFSSSEFTKS